MKSITTVVEGATLCLEKILICNNKKIYINHGKFPILYQNRKCYVKFDRKFYVMDWVINLNYFKIILQNAPSKNSFIYLSVDAQFDAVINVAINHKNHGIIISKYSTKFPDGQNTHENLKKLFNRCHKSRAFHTFIYASTVDDRYIYRFNGNKRHFSPWLDYVCTCNKSRALVNDVLHVLAIYWAGKWLV